MRFYFLGGLRDLLSKRALQPGSESNPKPRCIECTPPPPPTAGNRSLNDPTMIHECQGHEVAGPIGGVPARGASCLDFYLGPIGMPRNWKTQALQL